MRKMFRIQPNGKAKPTYRPRPKKNNFLKYWRVIRYYVKSKYNLTDSEIEMLLFLYDENIFTKEKFNDFAKTMSWDKRRFSVMVEKGQIKVWRERASGQNSALYELTMSSKRICDHIYKKLLQEETISEDPYVNKIFKGSNYMDKIYKKVIKSMNSSTLSRNDE